MELSAVVLTKNEEQSIERCLSSLSFCDEIIIVDDNSSDRTLALAKKFGATIYKRSLSANWADQKNFGLAKARGKWVLFIDADEQVSSDLTDEIIRKLKRADAIQGFKFSRHDTIWGKLLVHGEIGSMRFIRLARNGSGIWKRRVHEYWDVKGDIYEFNNPIMHYPHQTLREFIESIRRMSLIHSEELQEEGKRSSLVKVVFWPFLKFGHNYIFRLGFLDGVHGFIVAVLMSFHSFLAWGNLLLIERKK